MAFRMGLRTGFTRCALLAGFLTGVTHAQQWVTPTAEELAMTSVAQVPGAAAVYLYREENTDDAFYSTKIYVRMKVLKDSGKDFANLELENVSEFAGRTIHADGTVIPYKGKPYEKLVQKSKGYTEKVEVYSLPGVETGSILEWRYKVPSYAGQAWFVQSGLFLQKGHFERKLSARNYSDPFDPESTSVEFRWTPILPKGAEVQLVKKATGAVVSLDVSAVAPIPDEEYMPPVGNVSYRVYFYTTSFKTPVDYWKAVGKRWSESVDEFTKPGPKVKAIVAGLFAPAANEEEKLRKIYTYVTGLENTDFVRRLTSKEDKAQGHKEVLTVEDLVAQRRGSGDELAMLTVALARAAGLKANLMWVADRDERVFLPTLMSYRQLDDYIVVATAGGKDVSLDPGQKVCAYGELAWYHTLTVGLRQTGDGAALARVPGTPFFKNHVDHTAALTVDERGEAKGTLTFSSTGDTARRWRQSALRTDRTELDAAMVKDATGLLPEGMEVHLSKIDHLDEVEKPLIISYTVQGLAGSATGKRLLVPVNLFEARTPPMFGNAKRETMVDLRYSGRRHDSVEYKFPAGWKLEAVPAEDKNDSPIGASFLDFQHGGQR